MRSSRRIGVLGVVVVLGVGLAAGEASAFSASYDQKMTQGRKIYESKVAMKDKRFRMEMTHDGQAMVIIHNAEGTYTVMPSEGMAMKTPGLQPGQRPVEGADNYQDFLEERHAEKIGSETVNGYACDIYRYDDPSAKETVKAWVWKEKQFPVKFEMEASKTLIELSNIQVGANIPDTAFQLPAGIQVMDMGNLMGMGR